MNDIVVNYEGDDIVAYNKLLFEAFPQKLFDPEYLLSNSFLNTNDTKLQYGRGGVYSFEYKDIDLVLRHYHRGGFPAKFIEDKYLWTSLDKSRAMLEMEMLLKMHKAGLPVPNPAAVHIQKSGLTYHADIITVLIPNARTLGFALMEDSISGEDWQRLGQVIKKFHQHNCNHADLNAHNIMLDQKKDVYLIDFDRSEIKASSGKWQMKNLQRLKHSLEKLASTDKKFNYTATDFSSLMQGYAE
jgi:3-deoxy-D-manno-octulosonic acid kinase